MRFQERAQSRVRSSRTVPTLLNAEGRLRLPQIERPHDVEISRAAENPVDEKAVHDDVRAARRCGEVSDCLVGDPAGEPIATALGGRFRAEIAYLGPRDFCSFLPLAHLAISLLTLHPMQCRDECIDIFGRVVEGE